MKLPAGTEKLAIGVMGVVSLLLAWNLVSQYRAMQPGISHAHAHPITASTKPVRAAKTPSHAVDDLVQYDPDLHLAALSAQDSRPLPDEDRDPFDFVGGAVAPVSGGTVVAAQAPPPPPPPPPLPVKAVGYNDLPGGGKEAMVTFNDDVVVVHEGDTIGTKYKVVKINPTMVVIEDGDTHESHELPFPQ
jgi:hypothetical protein